MVGMDMGPPEDIDASGLPRTISPTPEILDPEIPLEEIIAPPKTAEPQGPAPIHFSPAEVDNAVHVGVFTRPPVTGQEIPSDLIEMHVNPGTSIFKDQRPKPTANDPVPREGSGARSGLSGRALQNDLQRRWDSFLADQPATSLVNVRVYRRMDDGGYVNMGTRYSVDLAEVRALDRFLPFGNGTSLPQRWIVAIQQNTARPDDERAWRKFVHERVGDAPPNGWSFDSVMNYLDMEVTDMNTANEIAVKAVEEYRRRERNENPPAPAPRESHNQQNQNNGGGMGGGMGGMGGMGGGMGGMMPGPYGMMPNPYGMGGYPPPYGGYGGRGGMMYPQMPYPPPMYPQTPPVESEREREHALRERWERDQAERERAAREARDRAEKDAQDRLAHERTEREARERVEREARERLEQEGRIRTEKAEQERKELEIRLRAEAESRFKALEDQAKRDADIRTKELDELRRLHEAEREARQTAERERLELQHRNEMQILSAKQEALVNEMRMMREAPAKKDDSTGLPAILMTLLPTVQEYLRSDHNNTVEERRAERERLAEERRSERERQLEDRRIRMDEDARKSARDAAETERNLKLYSMLGEGQMQSARMMNEMMTKNSDVTPITSLVGMLADNTARNAQLVMGLMRSGLGGGGGNNANAVDWNALLGQGFEIAGGVLGSLAESRKQQAELAAQQARMITEAQMNNAARMTEASTPAPAAPRVPAQTKAPAPAQAVSAVSATPTRVTIPRAGAESGSSASQRTALGDMVDSVKEAMRKQGDPNDVADMLAALVQTAVAFKLTERNEQVKNFVEAMYSDPEKTMLTAFSGVAPDKYLKAVAAALIERHGEPDDEENAPEPPKAAKAKREPEPEVVTSAASVATDASVGPVDESPDEPVNETVTEPTASVSPEQTTVTPVTEDKPKRGRRRKADQVPVEAATPVAPKPAEPEQLTIPTVHVSTSGNGGTEEAVPEPEAPPSPFHAPPSNNN